MLAGKHQGNVIVNRFLPERFCVTDGNRRRAGLQNRQSVCRSCSGPHAQSLPSPPGFGSRYATRTLRKRKCLRCGHRPIKNSTSFALPRL